MSDTVNPMILNKLIVTFYKIVQIRHNWMDTPSCKDNLLAALKEFAGYATCNEMDHYLHSEVFIAHYNCVLEMAKEHYDPAIQIIISKIRPSK